MNIASWNCRYGFTREKAERMKEYDPDILVIPECREMDMKTSGYAENRRDWYGDHKEAESLSLSETAQAERDLGIGVFWKEGITITQLPEWKDTLCTNSDFRYLVPYRVEGALKPFTLIAVWTKDRIKSDDRDRYDYVQKVHKTIDCYQNYDFFKSRVVLIGDFNSNEIWDNCYKKDRNHSEMVKRLKELHIYNCADSSKYREASTYYYYNRGEEKKVIDDYCFASEDMGQAEFVIPDSALWVPNKNGTKWWRGISDHCPIIVTFASL
jgi:exonuclease III